MRNVVIAYDWLGKAELVLVELQHLVFMIAWSKFHFWNFCVSGRLGGGLLTDYFQIMILFGGILEICHLLPANKSHTLI